jgi:hypothetical protein
MSYETVSTLKSKKETLDREIKLYMEKGKRGPYALSMNDLEMAFGNLVGELDKFESNYEKGKDPELRELADGAIDLYTKFKRRKGPEDLSRTELEYMQAFSVSVGSVIEKKSRPKYAQPDSSSRPLKMILALSLPLLGLILAGAGSELVPDSAYSGMAVDVAASGTVWFGVLCGVAICGVVYLVLKNKNVF